MNLKKAPVLLFTAALLLSSCAKKSIAGIYGFQMGKEKGTHFGLFIELTDKYVTLKSQPEVTNKYKHCEFNFTLKDGEEDESESVASILTILAKFLEQEGDTIKVPAYYYVGNKIPKTQDTELKLGIDFSFIQDVLEDVEISEADFPVLEPEIIEKIVYTTYSNNTITMYIPVGQQDAIFQLYWYGIDIVWDGDGIHVNRDIASHDAGTHPTKEEIDEINKTYGEQHSALGALIGVDLSSYRDYYTLAMGLAKK